MENPVTKAISVVQRSWKYAGRAVNVISSGAHYSEVYDALVKLNIKFHDFYIGTDDSGNSLTLFATEPLNFKQRLGLTKFCSELGMSI